MLELRYQEVLPRTGALIRFADVTGAYDLSANPGGYGGPNPLRAALAVLVVLGGQDPGRYSFHNTVEALAYEPATDTAVQFALGPNRDGIYQLTAVAVPAVAPQPGDPLNTLGYADGVLYRVGSAGVEVLSGATLTVDQLRELQDEALVLGNGDATVLQLETTEALLDEGLLEFVRAATDLLTQRQVRERYLSGCAHLDAVNFLFDQGRYPEASAQLAALTQQQRAGLPYQTGAPTRINSWNRHD